MTAISVTPSLVPATTPRRCLVRTTAKQTQHEKAWTTTSRCAIVTLSQSSPAPVGASRSSTSSQSRVTSRRMSETPSSSPPPPSKALRLGLPFANVTEIGTMTRWTSYPSTPLPPPRDDLLLGAVRARLRNTGDRCSRWHMSSYRPFRRAQVRLCRLSNGPAHASTRQQPRGRRGQWTMRGRKN
ncbi:hypothetical protein EDB83DRAFT_439785 [Lactarius deliciosus]|nr:hypothetical protein EDB83DRAFT_439785 [Lactarius deliciosus]